MKKMPSEVICYLESLKAYKELDAGKTAQRKPKPSPQILDYLNSVGLHKRLYKISKCKDRKSQYDIEEYVSELSWLIKQIYTAEDKQIIFVSKHNSKYYGEWINQQSITISDLTDYKLFRLITLGQKVNLYATICTFASQYSRTADRAFFASCLYTDVDFYNIPALASMDAQSVYKSILDEVLEPMGLTASFSINSGRGLYLYWLLSEPLIFTNESRAIYSKLLKKLVFLLEQYGADRNAADISRVLRIPQSRNQKSNSIVNIFDFDVIKDNPIKYSIEEIAAKLEGIEPTPPIEPKPKAKKPESKSKAKPTKKAEKPRTQAKSTQPQHFTPLTLAKGRAQDLEKWIAGRGYDITGCRNSFFLIYFTAILECDTNPYDRAKALFYKLAEPPTKRAEDSYTLAELDRAYKSALENQQKRQNNQKGYFSFSNKNIIDRLGITSEEQKGLNTIISHREKLNRKLERERRARRNEAGYTYHEQEVTKNYNIVCNLLSENNSVKDICNITGLSKSTIYSIKKFSNEIRPL